MPTSYLNDIESSSPYNASLFFWYFEARQNPQNAPTAIYLAGGLGESSMFGAVLDGGPCYGRDDANSTERNPWSMNEKVNMLYVDQPVGSGFSYDKIVTSATDLLYYGAGGPPGYTGSQFLAAYHGDVPAKKPTFRYGMLPSQNSNHTANTTGVAAVTLWHFSQA
jgi:carboxypeptidase D